MTPDINFRRRTLLVFYSRYLNADRALRLAQEEALSWFPQDARPLVPPIGNPGSRIRRLYDRRDCQRHSNRPPIAGAKVHHF